MRQAGVTLLDELTQTASIGPIDAAKHLRRFAQARARLAAHLATTKPELVLLIDFGDFNLPVVAPLAKQAGCRVVYYVSPQVWAWGRFRLRWVKRYVDRMLVLFKFEETFYQQAGVPVTWVGHPLPETARASCSREQAQRDFGLNPWRVTVGLLPGSRTGEIVRHLPLLLATARQIVWQMPGAQFLLSKTSEVPEHVFRPLAGQRDIEIHTAVDRFYDGLQVMDVAIVASGTATLEAALFDVPMVVVYRTSLPTYLAARMVVRVPQVALVNVLAGDTIVPEFIQHHAQPHRIAQEVVGLLRDEPRRVAMRQALHALRDQLGPPGAVERAARAVLEEIAH